MKPTFFCASFFSFFCPVRPSLPQAIFFPKILPFWDLRPTLSRREKATSRGWVLGTVLDEVAPQEKKENPFFWCAKEGEEIIILELFGGLHYSVLGVFELIFITVTVSLFFQRGNCNRKQFPSAVCSHVLQLQLHKLMVFELNM